MGRILRWLVQSIFDLTQLEDSIMASIEQLKTELSDTADAIAELKQTAANEKQEIADKLDALDTKVSQQTGIIEQLKQQIQGTVPDSILSELVNATASIKATTNEIRNIVETETPTSVS
jgi:regulator of replication initiation timing